MGVVGGAATIADTCSSSQPSVRCEVRGKRGARLPRNGCVRGRASVGPQSGQCSKRLWGVWNRAVAVPWQWFTRDRRAEAPVATAIATLRPQLGSESYSY